MGLRCFRYNLFPTRAYRPSALHFECFYSVNYFGPKSPNRILSNSQLPRKNLQGAFLFSGYSQVGYVESFFDCEFNTVENCKSSN